MQEDQKIEEYVISEDLEEKDNGGWKEKILSFLNGIYFVPIIIILIAIIGFCLGRISGLQEKREPVRVLNNSLNTSLPNPPPKSGEGSSVQTNLGEVKGVSTQSESGKVIASKNGTKYHYPWCSGAKQISAKNLITFNSIEEAKKAGYTPASNCKGLK